MKDRVCKHCGNKPLLGSICPNCGRSAPNACAKCGHVYQNEDEMVVHQCPPNLTLKEPKEAA